MSSIRTNLRKLLAASLAIWLSGVVFLITCHATTPDMADCPLMRMGAHCDKADKDKEADSVLPQTSEDGLDCCAFIPTLLDKSRNIHAVQQMIAPTTVPVLAPEPAIIERTNFRPPTFHTSALLTRNNTFLITRNFRI